MPGNAPPVADERSGLLAFLAQQRHVLKIAAYGLTDEQARLTPTASTLSVGGIIKHVAFTERAWMGNVLERPRSSSAGDYREHFRLRDDESLAGILELYDGIAAETEGVVAGIADLGQFVPAPPDPWFFGVKGWSVRWVLLHLIQETARHAGHADIIREAVDGATAFPLMAAVEGWPETRWMKPWSKADAGQGG